MSEKRFQLDIGDDYCFINDKIENKTYVIYNDRFKERWSQEIVDLLNDQQLIIHRDEMSIRTMMSNMKKLEKENEQLRKEKEYYKEYALQYLLEYEFYSDNFLDTIKNTISEEEVKKIKEEENKIIEALKKEGLYE